jgi:hypothetical protein
MAADDAKSGYWVGVSDEQMLEFTVWADLCRRGRNAYFRANGVGFDANPGTEAEYCAHAVTKADWPGGPWPVPGSANTLHQVGLMLMNSAAGRLGELAALLDAGEVFWSPPMHARGVMEVCARLFRIYTQPYLPHTRAVPPEAIKAMYAAAHREVIEAAFSARNLAEAYLALDPSDERRVNDFAHAEAEIARLVGAYSPLYDGTRSDFSTMRKLKLEDVGEVTLTGLVDALAEWIWPEPTERPKPLYKAFSGHAHASLDADIQLYRIEDSAGRRSLTRRLPEGFIDNSVLTAIAMFHRAFGRIVGFYGWDDNILNEFGDRVAVVFPDHFKYTA